MFDDYFFEDFLFDQETSQETVEIDVFPRVFREKAVLFALEEGIDAETIWIPKSLIEDGWNEDAEPHQKLRLTIPRWFAEQEGVV